MTRNKQRHAREWTCPVCKMPFEGDVTYVAPSCNRKYEFAAFDKMFDAEVARHQLTHAGAR